MALKILNFQLKKIPQRGRRTCQELFYRESHVTNEFQLKEDLVVAYCGFCSFWRKLFFLNPLQRSKLQRSKLPLDRLQICFHDEEPPVLLSPKAHLIAPPGFLHLGVT